MAVRNCAEIGENLQKIVKRLLANDDLVKLLYYTDKDPLGKPNLTEEEKKQKVYEKLIKVVPRIGPKDDTQCELSVIVASGTKIDENNEFRTLKITIETYVPLTQWIIKSSNLRPFMIMGEVQRALDGKLVNGLGTLQGGDFSLNYITEEMSTYKQYFTIDTYD